MDTMNATDESASSVPPPPDDPRSGRASPSFWLATGGGIGLVGIAPGTLGSLWGLPLSLAIAQLPSWPLQLAVIVGLGLLGIPICTSAARTLAMKDPGAVVWDEIASLPITFFLVPAAQMWSPTVLAAGFVLHRVFDISKPPPARQLESLPDGLGIMADDWAAGAYSCACLHLLLRFGWL